MPIQFPRCHLPVVVRAGFGMAIRWP